MRLVWLVVLVGCHAAAPEPTISNRAPRGTIGVFTITEEGFGPLHARSQATLGALRAAFSGYDVRVADDTTRSFAVYLADEKIAWVIPNDDGSLFNVHATSPKIETRGHDWRVGEEFRGGGWLTDCECWGDNPTCYRRGDHIAVNFKRGCEAVTGMHGSALRVLDGAVIQRVIWSPRPFAGEDPD